VVSATGEGVGVGLRDKMRRLEDALRGTLGSFELEDGSRYYFDATSLELFLHWCNCATADSAHDWPEPPEIYKKLTVAKDPERALDQVHPSGGNYSFIVYDPAILVYERRLEPRALISEYDPATGKHYPRDPWEHHPVEDLSEP
jgi:hypothetical protein